MTNTTWVACRHVFNIVTGNREKSLFRPQISHRNLGEGDKDRLYMKGGLNTRLANHCRSRPGTINLKKRNTGTGHLHMTASARSMRGIHFLNIIMEPSQTSTFLTVSPRNVGWISNKPDVERVCLAPPVDRDKSTVRAISLSVTGSRLWISPRYFAPRYFSSGESTPGLSDVH